ncbi:MAG: hypothetical protein RL681_645, partial [Candidatus Parcubacteria bacterium]
MRARVTDDGAYSLVVEHRSVAADVRVRFPLGTPKQKHRQGCFCFVPSEARATVLSRASESPAGLVLY